MADTLTPQERSERMRRIRGKDTRPEMAIRKLLFAAGYRYRVQYRGLPGRPDIVFPGRKAAIFVHGCFWHQHPGCKVAHIPKSREDYWVSKFNKNIERDKRNTAAIEEKGWRILIIWECEAKQIDALATTLIDFLGPVKR